MRPSSLGLTVLLAVIGPLACADGRDPLGPRSIAGAWSFSVEFGNPAAGIRCQGSGLVWMTSHGDSLAADGTFPQRCTGAPIPERTEHHFSGVLLDASTLRWDDDAGCTYTGRRTDDDALRGDVVCTVPVHERDVTLTGVWSATR